MRAVLIKSLKYFFVTVFLYAAFCCGNLAAFDRQALHSQALAESLIPVKPGVPGQSPFWNINSSRFIYVPSFDFKTVEGATAYRFNAQSEADSSDYTFEADTPWALLTPVWSKLPVGYVNLEVDGLDAVGTVVGSAGSRRFYRAAAFNGPYADDVHEISYCESARRGLKYLFDSSYLQRWARDGLPDSLYRLYCYPSKMIASIIDAMLLYAELSPGDKEQAYTIARRAAEYLIRNSEPAGSPLEFFPPTYDYTHIKPDDPEGTGPRKTALEYHNQIMLIYCARVGDAYLSLYEAVGDSAFLNAARKIADTYARIQLPDGNWYLKMFRDSGQCVTKNYAMSSGTILFLGRMQDIVGEEIYSRQIQLAEQRNTTPYEEFNFEGQFEDVPPSELYQNLSHWPAHKAVNYYFAKLEEDPGNLDKAKEIIRFAEDQFVVWEQPCPVPRPDRTDRLSGDWFVPCALEQYRYYVPIDDSAASFINSFRRAFEVTGDTLYLAKASALADQMVTAQDPRTGRYPTYWWTGSVGEPGWINCAINDAKILWGFGRYLEK